MSTGYQPNFQSQFINNYLCTKHAVLTSKVVAPKTTGHTINKPGTLLRYTICQPQGQQMAADAGARVNTWYSGLIYWALDTENLTKACSGAWDPR